MTIDLSQFYQVFFEESQEHLDNMEALLLDLDLDAPDDEQLNAIFRAAHSIKGSAGTFGFTDLAEVTHVLENLLDRIRKGELALRADMIDAFLDAGDVLKNLLAAHRGGDAADPAQVQATCRRLAALTGDAAPAPATASAPTAAAVPTSGSTVELSFVLDEGTADAGAVVDNLVAEIAERWPARLARRGDGPDGRWCLRVDATADGDVLRGMVEFIAPSGSLRLGSYTAGSESFRVF